MLNIVQWGRLSAVLRESIMWCPFNQAAYDWKGMELALVIVLWEWRYYLVR
jgi:hypothetical protein